MSTLPGAADSHVGSACQGKQPAYLLQVSHHHGWQSRGDQASYFLVSLCRKKKLLFFPLDSQSHCRANRINAHLVLEVGDTVASSESFAGEMLARENSIVETY